MQRTIELVSASASINGTINLPASKSISNRLLIIEAITKMQIRGIGYSDASDTQILQELIAQLPTSANAGAGGTTFRFCLAYMASLDGYEGVLSGSERLMERPVAPLVDALRLLGADIEYQQKEGFAPLIIRGKKLKGGKIPIDASTSSQFLSALLLVAPLMENDLVLEPQGQIISQPYLQMTIDLMMQCGFHIEQSETSIRVQPSIPTKSIEIAIEKDWSAASYWYSMVALSNHANITLSGLQLNSIQGDVQCAEIFEAFGVETVETESGIRLEKTQARQSDLFIDCIKTPDLFQTYAVTAAALNLNVHFSGLQSLRLKETDRIWAVCNELSKMGVDFTYPTQHEVIIDSRNSRFDQSYSIETYEDHRMAMAFAPLVLKLPSLTIQNPNVVKKSYPTFWVDIQKVL
jgi:3-phosphoshikimate 1-carboxyvinyltransferase